MYSPDTVTEALVYLRGEGYTADFSLVDGHLTCGGTVLCSVVEADVDRLFRFEGDSDPGDEMVVFAVVDLASGTKGTLASAFGSAADPDLLNHLIGLHSRDRSSIPRDSIAE